MKPTKYRLVAGGVIGRRPTNTARPLRASAGCGEAAGRRDFTLFKRAETPHAAGVMSAVPDYSFASDNTAGMAPEALAALQAANAGCAPSYGEDPWTARAKRLISELFAKDCEVFFV